MIGGTLRRTALCTAAVLALGAGTPLRAQDDGDGFRARADSHHRCRRAERVLRAGAAHRAYAWARGYVPHCPVQGPPWVAAAWRGVAADTAAVGALIHASAWMRDRRVYDALRETALDRARPDVVRVGALLALARYVTPHRIIWFNDVRPRGDRVRVAIGGSQVDGGGPIFGSEPLEGPVTEPILALFRQIAADRESERLPVWYAAAAMLRVLEVDVQRRSGG